VAPPRTILVVDPDPETLRSLGAPLRQRGYRLHGAPDGSRALQLALQHTPDLVLVDEDAPLVDARTLLRILRTNPRTAHVPVLLTGAGGDPARTRAAGFLRKPFDVDAVLARVEAVFRRAEAARAATGEAGLEGDLAELPLVDLLQILTANRRSGRLAVERDGVTATVTLAEGRIADATAGPAVGEKALYRLLARAGGSFRFVPGASPGAGRIQRRIEELLLEGMRHADETARLLGRLAPGDDRFSLAGPTRRAGPGSAPGSPADAAAGEVAALVESGCSVGELLDRSEATDLEVLRALAALIDAGRVRRDPPPAPGAEPAPFLDAGTVEALRARIGRGRPAPGPVAGKLLVAGGGPLARRAALARWSALPGCEPAGEPAWSGFGTVAALALGPLVRVDLLALPDDDALEPLWRPFAAGALAVLVLLPAERLAPRVAALASALPVGVCGPTPQAVEPALRAGAGAAYLGPDPAEALRALLRRAAQRP
jgi:DNA-binding response OmpR family regulator